VGARGIEAIETTGSSGTSTAYPLYDVHGNMVATVAKNTGGTAWTIANERSYDVWGSVRSGATTGGPKGRYCANLGHVQDDESGLIYMRARYYEPGTGRFISQDRIMDGYNWYAYCGNDPINSIAYSGNASWTGDRDYATSQMIFGGAWLFIAGMLCSNFMCPPDPVDIAAAVLCLTVASFHFSEAVGQTSFSKERWYGFMKAANAYVKLFAGLAAIMWASGARNDIAKKVLTGAAVAYAVLLIGMLIDIEIET
jgi:RHS repeat-associated protein